MNTKFKLNKNVYIILFFVFLFGVLLEISRSSYVLRFHPENIEASYYKNIELSKRLKSSLEQKQDLYLIVEKSNSPDSTNLKNNILQTLQYMHKKSEVVSLNEIPKDFSKFTGVILTFEQIDQFRYLYELEKYVEDGGSVFFAVRPGLNDGLYQIYRHLGMYDTGDFTNTKGIKLTSNLLIDQKGLTLDDEFIGNSSLAVGLEPSSRVHARSISNVPLLWDTPYKKGKYVVFNGTMLGSKDNRGLIVSSISLMKDDFIYPILNMKIAFIDDFPAPFPSGYHPQIYKETKMDTESFYKKIWWPYIQKGAEQFDVKYAGVVIETYNNKVNGPFVEDVGEQSENLIQYGRELLKMGGEIGIHGYNHQSLTTSQKSVSQLGYKSWKRKSDMEEALDVLDQYIKKALPNIKLNVYVPPSNIIDETGLSAIRAAIPSINVISSLYMEDPFNRSYVQEFNSDDQFINLPRITAGYEYKDENKWAIANAMTSIGVFSHFIHPDDILDEERTSNKTWSQLSNEYSSMLNSVKTSYPWLRSTTPGEAAEWVQQFSNMTIYTEEKRDKLRVYCDHFSGTAYFIFKTNKKIHHVKGCKVEKIDDGVYFVKGNKEIFELGLME